MIPVLVKQTRWPVVITESLQYRGKFRIVEDDDKQHTVIIGGFCCDGYPTIDDAQNEKRIPRFPKSFAVIIDTYGDVVIIRTNIADCRQLLRRTHFARLSESVIGDVLILIPRASTPRTDKALHRLLDWLYLPDYLQDFAASQS